MVIMFVGHDTAALPCFIIANRNSVSFIGDKPSTFTVTSNNGVLTINVGNTSWYSSEFRFLTGKVAV